MQREIRDLYILMTIGIATMVSGISGYSSIIDKVILFGLGTYFYYTAVVKPHLQREQLSRELHNEERCRKILLRAQQQFNNIREDLATIIDAHNEGAHMVDMKQIFEMYRDEIKRLYPILYGDEEFDIENCRKMEIDLAILLEETHPPKIDFHDKVVLH